MDHGSHHRVMSTMQRERYGLVCVCVCVLLGDGWTGPGLKRGHPVCLLAV